MAAAVGQAQHGGGPRGLAGVGVACALAGAADAGTLPPVLALGALDTLAESVAALASRNRRLVADLGPKATTPDGLKRHLEQNPIEAWTGGKGTGGTP